MHACRAGSKRRIQNCFTFHLGRAARNTDNHTRRNQRPSFGGFFNQHTQHTLGNHKISNHAVPHRADDFNIARRTALHFFCFRAHGHNFTFIACAGLNRNHGRLIQNNPFAAYKNQRVGRAQVDGNIIGEETR